MIAIHPKPYLPNVGFKIREKLEKRRGKGKLATWTRNNTPGPKSVSIADRPLRLSKSSLS